MKRYQINVILKILNFIAIVFAVTTTIIAVIFYTEFEYNSQWLTLAVVTSAYSAFLYVSISRMREKRLRQRRIFIIYSNKDRDKASKIVFLLREHGYNPWFAVDEIAPGQKWAASVLKGIAESSVALLLVSENIKMESSFIAEELKAAMSMMSSKDESFSPVIPVRLDDSPVPKEVSDVHWVDFRNEDGIKQLDKGLKRVLGTV